MEWSWSPFLSPNSLFVFSFNCFQQSLANIRAQNVCMCLGCLVTSECLALMSFLFISNTNISYLNTLHNGNWS